jgi:uncharacterized protein YsxB (DUF464 family)
MIKATFYRDSDGNYKGFTVSGHAGFARSGKDIVCSAVSALTINTVNSIEKLTDSSYKVEQDKSGTIKFKLSDVLSDGDGQLLLNSLSLGLTEIAKEYGDRYLQVYFKEV